MIANSHFIGCTFGIGIEIDIAIVHYFDCDTDADTELKDLLCP